jgi:F420-dependent oxidoreductase-like protein
MDRIGCFFLTARTFGDIESRILAAEELGYDACGLPSIAGRDALTTLALVAPKTSRIRLATGIVPIWTRTPVALAQEAGVLFEATGGRFMLGVGVGHEMLVESWHGTPFRRPVEAMRDYVTILRSAFRDGSVDHQGEVFRAGFGFLGFRPDPSIPILIGALGPKMLQLAGELADGVVLWMSSPRHIEEIVVPNLRIGAERAGRDPSELEVFACLFAAPGPDRASARDAVRRQLMPYMQLPFYRNMLVASGFGEDCDAFDEGMKTQDLPRALAGISDAMVDEIAATGSKDEVARTLDAFVRAGCTIPTVGVAGGYEGYEGAEAALAFLHRASALVA